MCRIQLHVVGLLAGSRSRTGVNFFAWIADPFRPRSHWNSVLILSAMSCHRLAIVAFVIALDKDWMSGPLGYEPGTSISLHASLVFFTEGGATLRAWDMKRGEG
jgi:hypothetical protein